MVVLMGRIRQNNTENSGTGYFYIDFQNLKFNLGLDANMRWLE